MNNVYYTSHTDVSMYSRAIKTVAYDSATDRLLVVWQNSPSKVYSYFGLPSAYSKIVDNLGSPGSVKSLVQDVTDTLQRDEIIDNAKLISRDASIVSGNLTLDDTGLTIRGESNVVHIPRTEEFLVTLKVEADYQVPIRAKDFNEAADKVHELFSQYVTAGGAHVAGVKKA